MIEAYFDGCCEPKNPGGHGAWGALVMVDGVTVFAKGGYVGHGPTISNNVAEYAAVIAAMEECLKHEGVCIIRGDSKLVVMQLRRKWKARGGLYVPFYKKAMGLWDQLELRAKIEWIPREKNDACDGLSKGVLKEMGVRFMIQPNG